jgi:hypothetical protein
MDLRISRKQLIAFAILGALLAIIIERIASCGNLKSGGQTVTAPVPPPPVPPNLKPCDQVTTFSQLQPLISLNCAGCHTGYDSYDVANNKIDEMFRRINLNQSESGHMPAQRPKLSDKDIAVFQGWKDDGLLKSGQCIAVQSPPQQFRDFTWTEQQMFDDINRISTADQPNIRYLIAVDKVNYGSNDDVSIAKLAAAKASNSISGARDALPIANVAPGIWRININDLRLSEAQWQTIENASQLQFESFTKTGVALKSAAKTRLPWMFVQDFNDTALRAPTYYGLIGAQATLSLQLTKLGVNFAGDLADAKAYVMGFNGSSLSLAANRLLMCFNSNDGAACLTEDTGPIVSDTQNVFKNPEPDKAAGGKAILKFAAGEMLFHLPNGMLAGFLADAAGNRLNQADPNVVHDFTTNPISPIIKNYLSCTRCHNGGFIHAVDQVRAALPGQNIGAADSQIVLALYKKQADWDQIFTQNNDRVANALHLIGIDPSATDPVSKVSDGFLGDLSFNDLAGFFFMKRDELANCLGLSQVGRQQVGQLLVGDSVSHDQLIPAIATLKTDCRIFQDPL